MRRMIWIGVLLGAGMGCGHGQSVAVPETRPPQAFPGAVPGPSSAEVRWRDWFSDAQLEPLVSEALRNNQDLKVALQRIESSRALVRGATGALLPAVAVGLGAGVHRPGLYTSEGAGNATTEISPGRLVPVPEPVLGLGLEAAWEVDLWGRLRSQRGAAIARYLASIEGTNLVLTNLIANVAQAYFELLALDHAVEILRTSVARQEQAVEMVRLQKEAGRANELAVQQFEAQLAETRASEREVAADIVETETRLGLLLGRYPRPVSRDKERLFAEAPPKLQTGFPAALLANRPDIREAELEVRAAQLDVKAARAAFFPSLTLSARAGLEAFSPAYLFRIPESLSYSAAGGILAPLLNRNALHAQLAGAKSHQLEVVYTYQRAILVAFTEVVNALSRLRHLEEILATKKAQKAAMLQTVSTADMLYRAGKATYLEVLVAERSALQADLDLIDAWKRRRMAEVSLYKALGGGWR